MMMGGRHGGEMEKESVSALAGEDKMRRREANLLLLWVFGNSLVILKAG